MLSFEGIWKSKIFNQRREWHLNNKKDNITLCKNCNVWDEVKGEEIVSPEFAEKVSILNT